jgi:hypothetical protein
MDPYSLCALDSYPMIIAAVALSIGALAGLVIYYVLMVRAILEMFARQAPPALLVFSLAALIPLPPLVVMGIALLVLWRRLKKTTVPPA